MHRNVVGGDDQKHPPRLPVQGLVQAHGQIRNAFALGHQQQGGRGGVDVFDAAADGSPGVSGGSAVVLDQDAAQPLEMLFEVSSEIE